MRIQEHHRVRRPMFAPAECFPAAAEICLMSGNLL